MKVTLPDAIVEIPPSEEIDCATFEEVGLLGRIDPLFCPFMPSFTSGPCGCAPATGQTSNAPSDMPSGSAAPSDMPSGSSIPASL